MRIGLFIMPTAVDSYVESVKAAQGLGYDMIWSAQIFGLDTISAICVAGREVPGMSFGTAVVPTYPRHPMMLAQQALTAQQATDNRFTLGIGLSHQVVIEGMWGMSFDKPARHMKEYLSILMPLLRGEAVNYAGETLTCRGQVQVPAAPPKVILAAMAPAMLRLAGAVADGTSLWMTGPETIRTRIIPVMNEAADKAGRPKPSCGASVPVCLTDDVDGARKRAAQEFVVYGQLPSYRAMLDAEGLAGPEDLAMIGNEDAIRAGIARMEEVGVDEFSANIFGTREEQDRTRAFIATLL